MMEAGEEPPLAQTVRPDNPQEQWMLAALAQAALAAEAGEVPIGAVVVRTAGSGPGEVVAARHNERETGNDPTAHAEVLALRDAAAALGRWRLDDCLLVVTLEPCPMCAGALWASRIAGVVWGAANDEAGALGSLYNLGADPRLNHEFWSRGGVRSDEFAALLEAFFAGRR
jgi:tRNA(adenine34) deaminase